MKGERDFTTTIGLLFSNVLNNTGLYSRSQANMLSKFGVIMELFIQLMAIIFKHNKWKYQEEISSFKVIKIYVSE